MKLEWFQSFLTVQCGRSGCGVFSASWRSSECCISLEIVMSNPVRCKISQHPLTHSDPPSDINDSWEMKFMSTQLIKCCCKLQLLFQDSVIGYWIFCFVLSDFLFLSQYNDTNGTLSLMEIMKKTEKRKKLYLKNTFHKDKKKTETGTDCLRWFNRRRIKPSEIFFSKTKTKMKKQELSIIF